MGKVIEEIRKLMLKSTQEVVNKGNLNRIKPATTTGNKERKKKKQQQQQSRGARGQLQGIFWDPRGFQHWKRGTHEKELMIFPAEDYDAGASTSKSNMQAWR
jgi:hypothetical protein